MRNNDDHAVVREAAAKALASPKFGVVEDQERAGVQDLIREAEKRVGNGQDAFLYHSVYLPVDSRILDQNVVNQFNVRSIQQIGLQGWEVVGVVPRTDGRGLTNTSVGSTTGTTWGGGMGGNVIGVHILLKKRFLLSDLERDRSLLLE
jgi:hypothetical protein